jgi:transcriptional regulator with XRE-family HTH domain
MTLGDRVRRRREELGMSQQDLAEKTGILQTLISRLERGVNTNPHTDVLLRLARALRCSVDWLIGLYEEDANSDQLRSTPVGA